MEVATAAARAEAGTAPGAVAVDRAPRAAGTPRGLPRRYAALVTYAAAAILANSECTLFVPPYYDVEDDDDYDVKWSWYDGDLERIEDPTFLTFSSHPFLSQYFSFFSVSLCLETLDG